MGRLDLRPLPPRANGAQDVTLVTRRATQHQDCAGCANSGLLVYLWLGPAHSRSKAGDCVLVLLLLVSIYRLSSWFAGPLHQCRADTSNASPTRGVSSLGIGG